MVVKQSLMGAAVAVLLGGMFAGPAGAHSSLRVDTFQQQNLVSDQPGVATLTDPDLVNSWGISRGPNSAVWVSDNGADVSTLYTGAVGSTPVSKVPLVVSVPGGAPTGQVFNDTTAFQVPGTTQSALFIFAGEHGDLSAWNPAVSPRTAAVSVGHVPGAVFKSLALVHTHRGPRLLAADFHGNRIDVFNERFHGVRTAPGAFRDRSLPRGYAPFNIAEVGGRVFVTYALRDAQGEDDVAGAGHGFVDVYSDGGAFLRRFASRGVLNSPWGMTIAPQGFGHVSGDLLVGNFGDGRIHAFDPRTGSLRATLRNTSGRPLTIEGLWALVVGNPVAGGTDAVWFSSGPDDEEHGLVGLLRLAAR
ncbi:TIGR03118 family protein [Nocardioides sp. CER19]|uniref:TIGR03118 family protein n=1 Tax=Nocardioides sp. CER19 TaxID=3038538 RepID=UPI002449F649|nr:TIGR03118 family protein [Nocardioides sp. CER19]MDH2416521.1 TIGR03118 family protein [Nocardioides sp. CER19]